MRCRLSPTPSPSPSPSPSPAALPSLPASLLPPIVTTTAILSSVALTLLIINYLFPKLICSSSTDEPPPPPQLPASVLFTTVTDAGKKTVSSPLVLHLVKGKELGSLSYGECSVRHSTSEEGRRCVSCSASFPVVAPPPASAVTSQAGGRAI